MHGMTCAVFLRPRARVWAAGYDVALILAGSLLLALSARVAFRIGPVPFTGQSLVVLMLGALLGSRRGVGAVVLYLAEGVAGLPVFSGGMGGAAWLLGPTGGYLLGFVPAAWVVGCLAERGWDRRPGRVLGMMMAGQAVLFAGGVAWLSVLVGFQGALAAGLWPFLPDMVLKGCLAAVLLPAGWHLIDSPRR